jgi:hypothetical protein
MTLRNIFARLMELDFGVLIDLTPMEFIAFIALVLVSVFIILAIIIASAK